MPVLCYNTVRSNYITVTYCSRYVCAIKDALVIFPLVILKCFPFYYYYIVGLID